MRAFIRKIFFIYVLALGSIGAMAPQDAWAMDYRTAKTQGLVGERPDGLIGAVSPSPSPDIQMIVKQVNTARLAKYNEMAAGNGVDLNSFKQIMGTKLIGSAPPGSYYMVPSGQWVRK